MNLNRKPVAHTRNILAAIMLMAAFSVVAEEYLGRDEFLHLAFGDSESEMQTLWLTDERRAAARAAVGWAPAALRLRYWQAGDRTAWTDFQSGWPKTT